MFANLVALISSPVVADEIARHIRGHLPPYSLPREIEFHEAVWRSKEVVSVIRPDH
jgi:hypothetical protein